ncbi:MAG: FAD-dependent oxidoreductase [Dehalococcoidia bacterium]
MTQRLVIVGGDAGGMSAATNARRRRSAEDLEIVAFERGAWASFSACGEPYFLSGAVPQFESLLVRSPEAFARQGIQVHLHHEVTAIDTAARRVSVRDLQAGRDFTMDYDTLVYATGAEPRRVPIEGRDLAGVHALHVLDDALAVHALLDADPAPRHGAVVGGGYVGLEVAEALHERGLATTIVASREGLLGGSLDPEMGTYLVERVRKLGIDVEVAHRVERLEGSGGRVTGVHGGRLVPADLVVLATGTVPRVELARAAGLRIGESGAVWVDDHQRTSAPGVYAAGDCVEVTDRVTGAPLNLHLGTIANRQGRIAGRNIGGADEAFPGVLGTAITRVLDLEVSRTGPTEARARAAGIDVAVATFDSTTMAGYWPASTRMRMRALADRDTRRIIGAQIVGGPTSAKRIDAMAMAIWNEMTVDDMVNVDLSYAPPFSGVWDPVLVAARKLQAVLDGTED